jgi:hypothetical protein
MLTFSFVFGFLVMVAIVWYALRLMKASAKESPESSRISNVGDLNTNNKLGKFGLDGL